MRLLTLLLAVIVISMVVSQFTYTNRSGGYRQDTPLNHLAVRLVALRSNLHAAICHY